MWPVVVSDGFRLGATVGKAPVTTVGRATVKTVVKAGVVAG